MIESKIYLVICLMLCCCIQLSISQTIREASMANTTDVVFMEYPSPCDVEAAAQCEYDNLICKLFTGPADDPTTLCRCGGIFYGECLRKAGCETHEQVGALSNHEVYMKTCIDLIMKYDCPSSLMCSINCATDAAVNPLTTKLIPFNNYGSYYLRIRICRHKVDSNQLARYAMVNSAPCTTLDEFEICSRWIPPQTFVPVALPIDTTYIEVDSCEYLDMQGGELSEPFCHTVDPKPVRMYGNHFIFPTSFDVPMTNATTCQTDADCLGSFCDVRFVPAICSKKTLAQVEGSGKYYLTT